MDMPGSEKGTCMRDLGYWWPFARTAWGWTVASVSGLAAIWYGPRKVLETFDWYMDRAFDHKVKEYLQTAIRLGTYTPAGGGVMQSALPRSIGDITSATGFSEKRVRSCLRRLAKSNSVMSLGNDMWKLVVPHLIA
jgi:hypothetical protein